MDARSLVLDATLVYTPRMDTPPTPEPPRGSRFSVAGAIVLAGIIIAVAIVVTRAPVRAPAVAPAGTGNPATSSAPPIALRAIDPVRDHMRGNADASVTLVEYSDTECPFCKQFHSTLQRAVSESNGKVRWVYRHFPLENLHSKAPKEAEATECANDQGKFWEYLDQIYSITPSNNGLDAAQLPVIARTVGLDVAGFETCLQSGKHAARIQEDIADAESAGGRGTPHTVILGPKGEKIPFSGAQSYENLKQAIDSLL
jgi:protein-disulfide isomerase